LGRTILAGLQAMHARRGWRYQSVKRERAPQTWIDPDTGLTCHDILGGFGSECSNF
jgi:hypothetical protein